MSRILLVDDDEDMMRLTGNWLKKAGHDVSMAASGQEALDWLGANDADLILLDYAMPGMDGPETFKAIKAVEKLKDIPVLFRTGMDDGDSAEIMGSLNPDGVVPKSEGKGTLMKAVAGILG